MGGPTERDREVARETTSLPAGYRAASHVERIAAALAAERARTLLDIAARLRGFGVDPDVVANIESLVTAKEPTK